MPEVKPVLCVFTYKSKECGYEGYKTDCDKTFEDCRKHGNQTRFGGNLMVPAAQYEQEGLGLTDRQIYEAAKLISEALCEGVEIKKQETTILDEKIIMLKACTKRMEYVTPITVGAYEEGAFDYDAMLVQKLKHDIRVMLESILREGVVS